MKADILFRKVSIGIMFIIVVFFLLFRFYELQKPDIIDDEDNLVRDAIGYYNKDPFINPRHHTFHHAQGSIGHPFFHIFLIYFSYVFFGISYASSRFPASIMSFVAATTVLFMSAKMFNKNAAYISFILFILSPLVFREARITHYDSTFAAIGGLCLYFFYSYIKEKRRVYAFLVGLTAALLFSTKINGIVIFVIYILSILILVFKKIFKLEKIDFQSLIIASSIFSGLFLLFNDPASYVDGIIHPSDPSFKGVFLKIFNFDWERLRGTLIYFFPWNFSVILLCAVLYALYKIYKNDKQSREFILLCVSLVILFSGFRFSLERGLIIFLVPATILSGALISQYIFPLKSNRMFLFIIFCAISVPYIFWYGFRTKPVPFYPFDYITHYYSNRLTLFNYLNGLEEKSIIVTTFPSTVFFPGMNLHSNISLIPLSFQNPNTTDYFLTDNKEIYNEKINDTQYKLVKVSIYGKDIAALFKRAK